MIDSDENLNRGKFVSELEQFIKEDFNNENFKVSVVGVLILYNNMLQSLFDSQISSLGIVMIGIFLMLIYLFSEVQTDFGKMNFHQKELIQLGVIKHHDFFEIELKPF